MARSAKQIAAQRKASLASAAKRRSSAVDRIIAKQKLAIAKDKAAGISGVDRLMANLNGQQIKRAAPKKGKR